MRSLAREESIAEATSASRCNVSMSTNMNGDRSVHGLWTHDAFTEIREVAVMGGFFLGPQCSHCGDVVIVAFSAVGKRDSECIKFFLKPTHTDAEQHATL